MNYIIISAKIIIFIAIINVWFFRFNKKTPYRGGDASSMKTEFASYGLSESMVYLIGALKVLSALSLIVSIWVPVLALPAAAVMVILMLGAIIMHFRIDDSLTKSLPAFIFLLLSMLIIYYSY
ncbi:DoxX family protein [Maribacter sp. ACAM166]|uniref:DoxX family protein n=1 Tax=Maribacter sp. ACAM166 TaxID=2508996 RepID=UPI0010FDB1F6|nr:DoxX family protein [Maribacter sp. ACAM166]TLP75415.1 DoxX family protein [Maribacter sp. ACAM166]